MFYELTTFLERTSPTFTTPVTIYQGESMTVSSSWDIYVEWSAIVVKEVQFHCETHWFLWHEGHLHLDHLPCHSQITTTYVVDPQINVGELLDYGMLQVNVLIATVMDL